LRSSTQRSQLLPGPDARTRSLLTLVSGQRLLAPTFVNDSINTRTRAGLIREPGRMRFTGSGDGLCCVHQSFSMIDSNRCGWTEFDLVAGLVKPEGAVAAISRQAKRDQRVMVQITYRQVRAVHRGTKCESR
jgi:hypothetical protein